MAPRLIHYLKSKIKFLLKRLLQIASQGYTPARSSKSSLPTPSQSLPKISQSINTSASPLSTYVGSFRNLAAADVARPTLEQGLRWAQRKRAWSGWDIWEDPISYSWQNGSDSVAPESMGNEIGKTQMKRLVHIGLERTQKEASTKKDINQGLDAVKAGK